MTEPSASWRHQGDGFAADYGQWEFQARVLYAGARACWDRHLAVDRSIGIGESDSIDLSDLMLLVPAQFLAATAVELFLKAIAIQYDKGVALVGSGPFYTHRLREIAVALCHLELSSDELTLLDRLGALVEWAGRYPIPKWTAEKHRQKFDVPLQVAADGSTFINAQDIPNAVSHEVWHATTALVDILRSRIAERSTAPSA
jgi:hypothetical protein